MKLSDWIDSYLACNPGLTRSQVYHHLNTKTGQAGERVSVLTISSVDRGMRLGNTAKAQALAHATGLPVDAFL